MSLALRFKSETCRVIAAGSIGVNYTAIGTAMEHPIRMIFLQNWTDASLMFSDDGINDKVPLPSSGHIIQDITANKSSAQGIYLAKGDIFYVKRIGVPTAESVYLSVWYGE